MILTSLWTDDHTLQIGVRVKPLPPEQIAPPTPDYVRQMLIERAAQRRLARQAKRKTK